MKKLYVFEIVQNKEKSYVGVAPARELVRLATTAELHDETTKFQRVIKESRLGEIAEFVAKDGVLAGAITIGTIYRDKLEVHKVDDSDLSNLYYIEFPETEKEFEEYKNTFDIMDGQHRLFSFKDGNVIIDPDIPYEITFNLYVTPNLREKRKIFKNTNEEQKAVDPNLLLWFRRKLDMLKLDEISYHPVVEMLNFENGSVLKGRIIMGDETNVGGYKANQIIKIFNKINLEKLLGKSGNTEQYFKIVNSYLAGWEKAAGKKFSIRDNDYAPFYKISGLRFMMLMLPAIYNKARTDRELFTKDFVSKTLYSIFASVSRTPDEIFSSEYLKGEELNPFSAETPTINFAEIWINKLKDLEKDEFDPLAY